MGRIVWGMALAAALSGPAAAAEDAVARLAESLRFETVSPADPADFRGEPFLAMHAFLAGTFPRVHEALRREVVADYSLLYTWEGRDPERAPVLLTSHLDVVPVPDETLGEWTHPPYAGVVADGFVWGRGSLDDKFGVMGTLEAVEALLAAGFTPERTVYLAFGHDEEIGGPEGAAAITDRLAARGVRLAWSLDEGMVIVADALAGLTRPAALIGVAEKGSVTLRLTARAPGGHSSIPPRESAIRRVARAVRRLESSPMPADMETIAGRTLDALAPHVAGYRGVVLRQRTLLGPLVERILSRRPATDALLRTTTAVTMARAGTKPNILPRAATVTVNFRILPGDTIADVEAHVRRTVDDPELEIERLGGTEPSAVSSTETPAFAALEAAVAEVFPEAVVAPALVLGGTDSKHYARIADDAYRFAPLDLEVRDTERLHGVDERIAVENYRKVIDFYAALLRREAGPGAP